MKATSHSFKELRRQAEELLGKTPAQIHTISGAEIKELVHELHVHQIELEMQNEELQRALRELEESRSQYCDLYDFAPVGYLTVDNGLITAVNLTGAAMLGVERRYLIKRRFTSFISPPFRDAYHLHSKRVFDTGTKQTCEVELVKKDGTSFSALLKSIAVQDTEGKSNQIRTTITDISDLKRAEGELRKSEEQIKNALKEKEVLMKEIHHRVKNNLQVISSLLRLQSRDIKDKDDLELFKDSLSRIKSMAIIHEQLYQSEDQARVNFAHYVRNLTRQLSSEYNSDPGTITVNIVINDILLNINTAIPCGLIINELVSNAFKHAFPDGKSGEINVLMHHVNGNEFELTVSDNGIGFPEDRDFRKTESFGMHLVIILVSQLDGTIELDRANGTAFKILFWQQK
jgi:PAS domain S-box-containing protein